MPQHQDMHAPVTALQMSQLMPSAVLSGVLLVLLLTYLLGVRRQNRFHPMWSTWHCAAFASGLLLLAVALAPPVIAYAHQDLRGHMLQHVLIGMLAPLLLVLAAPVTLLLRTLPAATARTLVAVLKSRPLQVLLSPETAFLLNIGGMYLLYLTPLYALTLTSPLWHALMHYHFLVAGYLFVWAILGGPDRAAFLPSFNRRLLVLFISIAAHAILGKLMYGYGLPRGTHHAAEEIREAAQWMYYGGDIAEILLLIALFSMRSGKQGLMQMIARA